MKIGDMLKRMITYCCRICAKKYTCKEFNKKENCSDCVSYVLLAMREIDKKLKEGN